MMITKYEFRGEKDGISLLILAAVHGNETAGHKPVSELLMNLTAVHCG